MSGTTCAVCKSAANSYSDGTRKMHHSTRCPHSFCEGCKTLGFASRHTVIKCPPPCGETLTKADFSSFTADEREFEKESAERIRLSRVFNKRRDDFDATPAGRAEWDAYSERTERLIAALVAGSEAEHREAEREVDEYKRTHTSDINRASAKRAAEEGREAEAARAGAAVRAANARAAAETAKFAERTRVTVKRFLGGLAAGEVDGVRLAGAGTAGGGGGSAAPAAAAAAAPSAALAALHEKLRGIKAARAAAAAATAPPPATRPCPAVRLPSFLGYAAEGLLLKQARALPQASLRGHWRAAGVAEGEAAAWAEAELAEMLLC